MSLNGYAYPALMAVLFGGITLAVVGIFLLAAQYHRFGRLSWVRSAAVGATVLYVFAVGAYTMLPLPTSRKASCAANSGGVDLDPMNVIRDLRLASEQGFGAILQNPLFLQLALNVALFIPLGILAVRVLGLHPLAATALGFLASAAIELTQYTGFFGVFCSYRVADVGDLITNTSGALLGSLLAITPLFNWIRTPQQLEASSGLRPLTRVRRLWGMVFDLAFFAPAAMAGSFLSEVGDGSLAASMKVRPLPEPWGHVLVTLGWILPLAIMLLPVLGKRRASLGQRCVWLRASTPDGRTAPLPQALACWVLGIGGYVILELLKAWVPSTQGWATPASGILMLVTGLFVIFDSSARGLSFRATGLVPTPTTRGR